MTTRYTNTEWQSIISQAVLEISKTTPSAPAASSEETSRETSCPEIGSLDFTKTIDHTLLKLDAKSPQFDELCSEARINRFASVCVRPQWVKQCVSNLKGTDIKVASVIGFHEGTYDLLHKIEEAKLSLDSGASELDIVINHPLLQTGQEAYGQIYNELATLRSQAPPPVLLKLILETSQLSHHDIIAACVIAAAANFDFVKTSTGFNGHGATEEHVRLMAASCTFLASSSPSLLSQGPITTTTTTAGKVMQVKASGGIRTLEDAVKMLSAGASRLGTSAGVWIAKEARESVERNGGKPPETDSNDLSRPALTTRLFTDY